MVNTGSSNFFKATRGLRKGDPFSPLLFIMVMGALNKLLVRAREVGIFRRLWEGKGKRKVEIIHFFADDTLLLCDRRTMLCIM